MPNMSYCRMENTYADLRDCYENWDEASSVRELEYRVKILKIAQDIVGDFGDAKDRI
jgi:hypothetical protein